MWDKDFNVLQLPPLLQQGWFYGRVIKIKPLHDLNSAASDFARCIMLDLKVLRRYRHKMCKEKDTSVLKSISKTLSSLELDTREYKKWAECETEAIEKQFAK